MPEISRFFGIIVSMFYDDHQPPHFHARYGENDVVIDINKLSVLRGNISPRALGLVIEWATLHQESLIKDWDLVSQNCKPKRIPPLK
jgi:hypothetical protein